MALDSNDEADPNFLTLVSGGNAQLKAAEWRS